MAAVVFLLLLVCLDWAWSRPAQYKVQKEGGVLRAFLEDSSPERREVAAANRKWVSFQKFARSHENRSYASCRDVGFDDGKMQTLRHVDHSESGGRKKRVLYLTTVQALFTITDRWSFHLFLALASRKDFNVLLWGVGLPGFNANETLSENVIRWFVAPSIDIIVSTWNFHRCHLGIEPWKNWKLATSYLTLLNSHRYKRHGHWKAAAEASSRLAALPRRATEFNVMSNSSSRDITPLLPGDPIIVYFVHEIEQAEQQDLAELRPHLLLVQYEQQLGVQSFQAVDLCGGTRDKGHCPASPVLDDYLREHPRRALAAYVPHAIHAPLFFNSELDPCSNDEKSIDAMLIGRVNPHLYPLRSSLTVAKKSFTNYISEYKHPGYLESSEWSGSLAAMCEAYYSSSLGSWQQERRYIDKLRSSRFCLIGSRSYNEGYRDVCQAFFWPLRKYAEAMASGCIVAGDPPSDSTLAGHLALRLTSQTPSALSVSIEELVEKYKKDPGFFKQRYCDPARQAIARNFTYDFVLQSYFKPALLAYMDGLRGIYNNSRSQFLLRNDDYCESFDGQRTTWTAVGNRTWSPKYLK